MCKPTSSNSARGQQLDSESGKELPKWASKYTDRDKLGELTLVKNSTPKSSYQNFSVFVSQLPHLLYLCSQQQNEGSLAVG